MIVENARMEDIYGRILWRRRLEKILTKLSPILAYKYLIWYVVGIGRLTWEFGLSRANGKYQ